VKIWDAQVGSRATNESGVDPAEVVCRPTGDLTALLRRGRESLMVCQPSAIGYFARIAPIRLSAFSAAACGVMPSRITSPSAAPHNCWAFASAKPGLNTG